MVTDFFEKAQAAAWQTELKKNQMRKVFNRHRQEGGEVHDVVSMFVNFPVLLDEALKYDLEV